jgi:hypothetical protein
MHLHLPPAAICAIKGLAGSPELPITGQLAMQGFEVNVVGSDKSQQSTMPHAYLWREMWHGTIRMHTNVDARSETVLSGTMV